MSEDANSTDRHFNFTPISWVGGMFPLYIAPVEHVHEFISLVHEQGYGTFFILANEEVSHTANTQTKSKGSLVATSYNSYTPKVFKVTENISGSAVVPVEHLADPLSKNSIGSLSASAMFHLPSMPFEMVQKLDSFFREVFKKYGTEAIVVFTYDQSYADTDNPSDGWGFLVPKQENTAASCDYDQSSIMEQLPDDCETIYQVGTAHSHPHMDAYCSGTDKADQAEFDGIHITFGWKPGLQTDFHIELQIAGKAFSLKPEQVFADVTPAQFEDMESLISNVSKYKVKPTQTAVSHAYSGSWYGSQYIQGSYYAASDHKAMNTANSKLPPGCPSNEEAVIIVDVDFPLDNATKCPACEEFTGQGFKDSYRCYRCMTYFMPKGIETVPELVKHRSKKSYGSYEIDIIKKPAKSIWVVETDVGTSTSLFAEAYAWEYYEGTDSKSSVSGSQAKNDTVGVTPSDYASAEDCTCGMPISASEPFCSYCHTRNWMYDEFSF